MAKKLKAPSKSKKLKSKPQSKRRTKTRTSDKNAGIIRRGYNAFNRGDMKTLTKLFDENASWHTPGRSMLAGDHNGREAIFAYFGRLGKETGGTFKAKLLHLLADDDRHMVGIHQNTAERGSKRLDTGCCIIFELKKSGLLMPGSTFTISTLWTRSFRNGAQMLAARCLVRVIETISPAHSHCPLRVISGHLVLYLPVSCNPQFPSRDGCMTLLAPALVSVRAFF